MAAAAVLFKATEDHLSEASESTASGSPSEPPMSPEFPKLSRGSLKPQELLLSCSTGTMSPIGLTFDTDSVPSPQSSMDAGTGSLISLDSEMRPCGAVLLNPAELSAAGATEQLSCAGTPKALPPAPKYSAPTVVAPSVPPPPVLPPGVPEPPIAPPQLPGSPTASTLLPPWQQSVPPSTMPSASQRPAATPNSPAFGYNPPAMLARPPTGMTCPTAAAAHGLGATPGAALPDASQRAQLPRHSVPTLEASQPAQSPLLSPLMPRAEGSVPPALLVALGQALALGPPLASPTGAPAGITPLTLSEGIEGEVTQALALLNFLWTGPSVPPLPPSGCYGGVLVSSAISEGLGVEAAEAAEAAARQLGERPVKVLLPWYPAHPGVAMFDQTKPAKVPTSPDHDVSRLVL